MATAASLGFGAALSSTAIGSRRSDIRVLFDQSASTSSHNAVCLPVVQPVAKRICDLTGKKWNNGYKVSFSNHREKHIQYANLQDKKIWWEAGKRFVRLRLSTKALKTLEWKGLDKMAKEAGIDLKDY